MNFFGCAMNTIEVFFVKCKCGVSNNEGLKPEVACGAGGRLDGVVCTDPDDKDRGDCACMKPSFKARVDEGIRNIFLNHMLGR